MCVLRSAVLPQAGPYQSDMPDCAGRLLTAGAAGRASDFSTVAPAGPAPVCVVGPGAGDPRVAGIVRRSRIESLAQTGWSSQPPLHVQHGSRGGAGTVPFRPWRRRLEPPPGPTS